jgi:hypothetical protein
MGEGNHLARKRHSQASHAIAQLLSTDPRMRGLVEFLLSAFGDAPEIFVVGGALRDRLLSPPRQPKDIDVMVAGIGRDRIRDMKGGAPNFFGGATLAFNGLAVDLWPLEDTFHIREFHLPKTIGGYLSGAPFNLDKIAYGLRAGALYDQGCLAGLACREIVYAPARAYLEGIQALRCVLLTWKTSFTLDHSASELLSRVAERLREDSSVVREMKRYLFHLKQPSNERVFDQIVEEILRFQPQETHA